MSMPDLDQSKPVFIALPPELFKGEGVVWMLKKSLYSLKQ